MDADVTTVTTHVKSLLKAGQTQRANALVDTYVREHPENWWVHGDIYNLSYRFTDTLRVEQIIRDTSTGQSPKDRRSLLILGNTARAKLWMHDEILERIGAFQNKEPSDVLDRQRAAAFAALHRHAEAVKIYARLYAGGNSNCFPQTVEVIRRSKNASLIEKFVTAVALDGGQIKAAHTVVLASLRHQVERGDLRTAFLHLEAAKTRLGPRQFVKFAAPLVKQLGYVEKMGELLDIAMADIQQNGMKFPADLYGFANIFLKTTGNDLAIRAFLDELDLAEVPNQANLALPWLRLQGRLQTPTAVRTLTENLLAKFPEHLGVWSSHLSMLGQSGDRSALDEAKKILQERIPPVSYCECLIKAGWTSWDGADIQHVISHATTISSGPTQAATLNALYHVTADPQQLERQLAPLDLPSGTIGQLWMHHLKRKCTNRRRLMDCVAKPQCFKELTAICADETQHFQSNLTSFQDEVLPVISKTYATRWFVKQSARLTALQEQCDRHYLFTNESFCEALRLVDALGDRIERKIPTSVIRLGDGEGHFVDHELDYGEADQTDRSYLQQKWWGDTRPTDGQAENIVSDFRKAVACATMLGVAPYWRLMSEAMRGAEFDRSSRGIARSFDAARNLDLEGTTLISSHYHHDLEAWNVWPNLFGLVSKLSWISCHDLEEYLGDVAGVSTRQAIRIPPQHSFASLFNGPGGQTDCSGGTLLDLHEEICNKIAPKHGELWLISAGFLGKIYCDIVFERGGIGIDIGSASDYWLGHHTRIYTSDGTSKQSMEASLFQHPPQVLAKTIRMGDTIYPF